MEKVHTCWIGATIEGGVRVSYVTLIGVRLTIDANMLGVGFFATSYRDRVVGICACGVTIRRLYLGGDDTAANGLIGRRVAFLQVSRGGVSQGVQ